MFSFYPKPNKKMDLKSLKTSQKYYNILYYEWINSMKDFFLYMPRDYEDRRQIKNATDIILDWSTQTVKGQALSKNMIKTPRWKTLIEISLQDEKSNKFFVNILHSTYYMKVVQKENWYQVIGKPKIQRWKIIFWNPKIVPSEDLQTEAETGRIYPIYSELMWIKPSWFSKKILKNIGLVDSIFEETLPKEILQKYNLMWIKESIKNIHFPQNFDKLHQAQYRIYFDKLLQIQLISQLSKHKHKQHKKESHTPQWDVVKNFLTNLPFQLTTAQKKATKKCIEDVCSWVPMMRLLQWDVGSGKTIVATILAFYMKKVLGQQAAFLAPTEVLANQHFLEINKFLLPLWIKIDLLVGSTTPKNKDRIKQDISSWRTDIVIWTTAVIQKKVNFNNLWLVIIDEQHKFWVKQRWYLRKFDNPHVLQMTATPIPRSLAIAFFGEFDISIIDEMPAGRKPIYTKLINEKEIKKIKQWILQKIQQWQQVYIITPLIEESESLDNVSNVMEEFENTKILFEEIKEQIWVLHGKMSSKEKEQAMKQFKNNETKILVSTTVIEVWVDSPTATIMIIKSAERFGLSQLHQLRWRVGRSDIQSYCFLVANSKWEDTIQRLKNMEKYTDWFKLSEIDLQNRGGGEILWLRQSWQTDIPISILTDTTLLENVQQAANEILSNYPNLKWVVNLKQELQNKDKDILS